MLNDLDRAHDALYSIPADLPRDDWVKAGMGFHAAGGDFDTFDNWSASAPSYNAQACRDMWKSIKPGRGVGAGTLQKMAADNGGRMGEGKPQRQAAPAPRQTAQPPRQPAPGMSPADVWGRCEAATAQHPYIVAKRAAGVPLDGLRVLPAGDGLCIGDEPMAGSLVVPVNRADGSISSLQFIAPPDVAARLKAKGKP
ncbi:PriCT-2 domain-containing protein, partial [Polaromonas sp. DSR2-3-2]|uniref:PriCT-2 domain-containing protein n=2 Tax=unclassified Polaromonas TaxID=2638319 RepID=UPI003CE6C820